MFFSLPFSGDQFLDFIVCLSGRMGLTLVWVWSFFFFFSLFKDDVILDQSFYIYNLFS